MCNLAVMRYSKSSPLVGVTNASMHVFCCDVVYLMMPSSAMKEIEETIAQESRELLMYLWVKKFLLY